MKVNYNERRAAMPRKSMTRFQKNPQTIVKKKVILVAMSTLWRQDSRESTDHLLGYKLFILWEWQYERKERKWNK